MSARTGPSEEPGPASCKPDACRTSDALSSRPARAGAQTRELVWKLLRLRRQAHGADKMATQKLLGYLWTLAAVSFGLIALSMFLWVLFAN
jgi:hypothetical protein